MQPFLLTVEWFHHYILCSVSESQREFASSVSYSLILHITKSYSRITLPMLLIGKSVSIWVIRLSLSNCCVCPCSSSLCFSTTSAAEKLVLSVYSRGTVGKQNIHLLRVEFSRADAISTVEVDEVEEQGVEHETISSSSSTSSSVVAGEAGGESPAMSASAKEEDEEDKELDSIDGETLWVTMIGVASWLSSSKKQ